MRILTNRIILPALLVIILIAIIGFHFIEAWRRFDGLYMVVTTLMIIGYQEVHPLSHAGRVFNIFVMFAVCRWSW